MVIVKIVLALATPIVLMNILQRMQVRYYENKRFFSALIELITINRFELEQKQIELFLKICEMEEKEMADSKYNKPPYGVGPICFKTMKEIKELKKAKNIIKKNPEIKTLLKNQSVEVNKTIAIEELSELQKEICKDLRGVDRRENIKEEMADVYICLQLLKEIYGFTDEELEEEYKRKMKRNLDRVKV